MLPSDRFRGEAWKVDPGTWVALSVTCELCDREAPDLTTHHLVPRDEDGRRGPTAVVCNACHRQLHAMFDNRTLARSLSTVDDLRSDPRLARFLGWVRRQPPGRRIRIRPARRR